MKPKLDQPTRKLLQELAKRWEYNVQKVTVLNQQIAHLTEAKDLLFSEMRRTNDLFQTVSSHHPEVKLPALEMPLPFLFEINGDLSLGDAIALLIERRDPMTQREIIDLLRQAGYRLNRKNPHVVVANAIRRDARKRFVRCADGKIALAQK